MSMCKRCGEREPCGCAEKKQSRQYNTASASQSIRDEVSSAKTTVSDKEEEVKYHRKQ